MKKKKIWILIIIVFILLVFINLVKVVLDNEKTDNNEMILEKTTDDNVVNEDISEENTVVTNVEIFEDTENEVEIAETLDNSSNILTTSTVTSANENNKYDTTSTVQTTDVSPTFQVQEQQEPIEQANINVQETKEIQNVSEVEETVIQNNSSSITTENTQETIPEETFVYNAQMTQKLIDTINNNPSQLMQTYGYTVTIDSSITSLTNQFTFYENRVIEKITNKAGNIRVYAQDYYYYGEYLFTECYII